MCEVCRWHGGGGGWRPRRRARVAGNRAGARAGGFDYVDARDFCNFGPRGALSQSALGSSDDAIALMVRDLSRTLPEQRSAVPAAQTGLSRS